MSLSPTDDASCLRKRPRLQEDTAKSDSPETSECSREYKPNSANSSMSNSVYTNTNTVSHMPSNNSNSSKDIMASSFIATPMTRLSKNVEKPNCIPDNELLEIELLENKIKHNKIKWERELAHQTERHDLENKILMLEYEHKKRMIELVEAEQKAKLEKVKNGI